MHVLNCPIRHEYIVEVLEFVLGTHADCMIINYYLKFLEACQSYCW